jgi:uncharacterized membrane protein HdeD (DUF308 family)
LGAASAQLWPGEQSTMDTSKPVISNRRYIAATLQSHWLLFVLVGALLVIAGIVAITVPAISSIEPNELLGLVLAFVGIVQIVQSGKMQGEALFAWHLTFGLLAVIGGVLVYLDPFPGVVTITVLMAIVFAIHGVTQIAFGAKVRQLNGWHWFLVSGFIALIVAGLLMIKLPYGHTFTPASVGGVSLLFAGWAYLAVALASRGSSTGSPERH